MKERIFDIVVILMVVVVTGVTGGKTDLLKGAEQTRNIWTLEEASFLNDSSTSQSLEHSVMQAVTRQNEGSELIFKCRVRQIN